MTEPLFEPTSPQWRIEKMQLVNWGSWHGPHVLSFHEVSTLLSGSSGTGKSTVMDAYTALMMPGDVPFNGASNDAVSGRARSETQRNVVSYVRGKRGEVQDSGTASVRAKVLRGADGPTWSAVSATFVSTSGERFTALRAYHLPASVVRMSEGGTMKMATYPGDLNLADLEGFAAEKFHARALEKRWPGMQVTTKFAEYSTALTTRLGIGRSGDGLLALRLLARIQAGQTVSTVDDTYKSMVLETPMTFAKADTALEHFEHLESAYEEMQEEEKKLRALEGIESTRDRIVAAQDLAMLMDSFGVDRPGDTPLVAWASLVESELVDSAEVANGAARASAREVQASAAGEEARLQERLIQIRAEQDDAGGSVLERLDREIEVLSLERDSALESRRTFDRHTAALAPIESAEDLAAAVDAAAGFISRYESDRAAVAQERQDLMRSSYPVHAETVELKAERESLKGRSGRVPRDLHEARVAIAEAAGLPVEMFPFVAELLDVPDPEAQWRVAIETSLFGLARTLIVDASVFERVSRAIDPLHLGVRVNFQSVPAEEFRARSGDPARISGKLAYKPGPYTNWVASRVASPGVDALCVASPADLAGSERRVTASGQMRHGASGAHGRSRASHIIGFSSEERLAEIEARLAELEEQEKAVRAAASQLDERERDLENLRAAYQQVQSTTWRSIDTGGISAEITERQEQKRAVLKASNRLAELARQAEETAGALELARERKHQAAGRLRDLEVEHAALVDRADELTSILERIDRAGAVVLTDEQRAELDALYAKVGSPGHLESFAEDRRKVASAASERVSQARMDIERETRALVRAFREFNEQWPDSNRGETLQDYDDFKAIVDRIQERGLAEKRIEFAAAFAEWTSDDLLPLFESFDSSIELIEDRLRPVNAILADLDFGPKRQRLHIALTRRVSEEVRAFRQDLRRLASHTTRELSNDEVVGRFTELRNFLNRLRPRPRVYLDAQGRLPKEPPPSRRDALLDVRRHVKVTAVASDQDGTPRTTYDAIGHLSGGETQELVAFIVGAALRYQLGDEEGARSAFAPVWLDEAFIKADSEFTSRAVNAWLGFGFQLIVASPNEKTSGLEPQMARVIAITKSDRGHSHATVTLREATEAA